MNEVSLKENINYELMEKVIAEGDLAKLNAKERVIYYNKTCESLGLNPLTKPFSYIRMNGKLVMYTNKDATEQLRKANKVSITKLEKETIDGVYIVTAHAISATGQEDVATGAVTIAGKRGDDLANAMMKAETKAKRRVTLSICGLGWTDESEIESIKNIQAVNINYETGELTAQKSIMENKSLSSSIDLAFDFSRIESCATLDELKTLYSELKEQCKDHPEHYRMLNNITNDHKKYLEDKGSVINESAEQSEPLPAAGELSAAS